MSQALQEPPANQFPPADAYTRAQPTTPAKGAVDFSALQANCDNFAIPEYIADFDRDTSAIDEAVSKILHTMEWVQKRGWNDFHKYRYATADDLREHVAHLLGEHGLSYEQHEVAILQLGPLISVTYAFRLCHKSGVKGIWERCTSLATATTRNGSPDDKAISKARTLALKDWAKSRFSIPTGEDTEPAGGDDPDADEATPVGQQLERKRGTDRSVTSDEANNGKMVNLRQVAQQVVDGKAAAEKVAADSPAAAARKWVQARISRIRLKLSSEPDSPGEAVSSEFSSRDVQESIRRLAADKGELRSVYDTLVRELLHPDLFKHTGGLSSVFPQLHADIAEANKNGRPS